MTDTWILDAMPPHAGTYDVTLNCTSRRGATWRCLTTGKRRYDSPRL